VKPKHILAWAALAVLLLGLWVWQAVQEDATSSMRAAGVVSSAPVDEYDIRVDAWAADTRVIEGGKLPVLITIYNSTKGVVFVSFARFQHPGFAATNENCWREGIPRCVEQHGSLLFVNLPRRLAPRESVTFAANLLAGTEPGRFAIAAVVAWGDAPENLDRRKPIALRPITVEGRFASGVLLFLRAFQSFVKDLALPLALAFLGFWLKQQEDARADQRRLDDEGRALLRKQDEDARATRRKEEEEARAARRRQEEEERDRARRHEEEARLEQRKAAAEKNAQTQQTWNLMLLKSHQNAERHYMPMGTAAMRVSEYWRRAETESADYDLCFFSYLLFLARIRRMIRSIGGFYFKSRSGEIIARTLWSSIVDRSDALFTRSLRERGTRALPPNHTYAEYRDSIADLPDVKEMKRTFDDNRERFAPLVPLFEALALILEFEMNRPYENWYQQREQFNHVRATAVAAAMREFGAELSNVADTFEAYIRQVARENTGVDAATV
jgi:hypothetical protein